jgi:hypothetical protein
MAELLKHTLGNSERVFYGNSLADWVAAGVVAVALWAALWIVRRLIASRYTQYSTADHPTPIRVIFYSLFDLQQAVNFCILGEFRRLGVKLAYPTQRVLVENQEPV